MTLGAGCKTTDCGTGTTERGGICVPSNETVGTAICGPFTVLHNFYPHRGIDGMCLDVEGNIIATAGWEVSGPGPMIYVFAPNGRVLETHPFPTDRPTNCAFGDPEMRSLYSTGASGPLYRVRTERTGYRG